MHRHNRSTSIAPCRLVPAVLALALAACGGDGAAPAAPEPADPAVQAPAPGGPQMMTAAPVQSSPEPLSTPLVTAEAAPAATRAAAALLPEVLRVWGVAGSEPGQMTLPFDVAGDGSGSVYVSDTTGVSKYSSDGEFLLRVGEGELPMAEGLVVGSDGLLYVTGYSALVQVYDGQGRLQREIGEAGEGPGRLRKPTDLAFDSQGNLLVTDAGNRYVARFAPDGRYLGAIGGPGTQSGQFTAPRSLALDGQDRLIVGMGDDFLLQRFTPEGEYYDSFGQSTLDETLYRVGGVAVDPERQIAYVTQSVAHGIQAFDLSQEPPRLLWQMGGLAGAGEGQFNGPTGIYYADGELYVADTRNHRIQVLDVGGQD